MQKSVRVITKGENNSIKKIERISLKITVKNAKCIFNITDIIFQTGDKNSIWNCHPSEVRWDLS